MLHWRIDPTSGVPVYRQLADQVKFHVASGALRPGDALPSIRRLAQELSINPTTVVRAYDELEHESIVELRQGKGAFVAERAPSLSAREVEGILRESARRLAVEANQLGASRELLLALVREAVDALKKGGKRD